MLELKKLHYRVTDPDHPEWPPRDILNGISFQFEPGGMYAITGPNGGGKTTTAKMIMGIDHPTAGHIIMDGRDITDLSITQRAEAGIAYGFQNPARFKGLSFRDLLTIAAGTENENDLVKILSRVGICSMDFLDKPVNSKLSGGEIKKIELATIIARNPRIAIYDEPDTGIDLWTIGPMVDLLKREQAEFGTTTIIITHNTAFLEAADEVLLLKNGEITFRGKYEQALPLLSDLSLCELKPICEDERYAGCVR